MRGDDRHAALGPVAFDELAKPSGAVLVEQIFAWPGMGRLIVSAVFQRDFPVVLGTTFFITVFVILGNLVADILYAIVDPRIRFD